MSRVFVDESLLTWEVYPSGGDFGLPDTPKIIFHCVSDPGRRARFLEFEGDDADAARAIEEWSDREINARLDQSEALP